MGPNRQLAEYWLTPQKVYLGTPKSTTQLIDSWFETRPLTAKKTTISTVEIGISAAC
jgi:hypothetical protein